jgi:hypothetical protein
MLRIARVDRVDGPTDITLRVQSKAQVGERQLDPTAVSVSVQAFTAPTKPPVTQTLTAPANWENFTCKQLSARFAIPPAQYAGSVVRTYYRNQLQDVWASSPALTTTGP